MIGVGESTKRQGAVCFTFDDYHGENWLSAAPLFRKYGAHATFFVVGEITSEKAEVQLFPFPPTNFLVHSRKRKVAG